MGLLYDFLAGMWVNYLVYFILFSSIFLHKNIEKPSADGEASKATEYFGWGVA